MKIYLYGNSNFQNFTPSPYTKSTISYEFKTISIFMANNIFISFISSRKDKIFITIIQLNCITYTFACHNLNHLSFPV